MMMRSRQAQGGQAGEAGRRSYRLALERLEERILLGGAFPLGGQEAGDPLVGDLLPGKPSGDTALDDFAATAVGASGRAVNADAEAGGPLAANDAVGTEKWSFQTVGNVNSSPAIGGDLAEIHGRSWQDLDADGLYDADETAAEGRTVYLDANENGQLDAGESFTVTGADGAYSFAGLAPGAYLVAEEVPLGHEQTWPSEKGDVGLVWTLGAGGSPLGVFDAEIARGQFLPFVEVEEGGGIWVGRSDTGHGTDQYNPDDMVAQFTPAGVEISTVKGPMRDPSSLAVDSAGSIYVGGVPDGGSLSDVQVFRYDSSGSYEFSFGHVSGSEEWNDLLFASGDRLFGTTNNPHSVREFSTDGTELHSAGSFDGSFRFGRGLALSPDQTILWDYAPKNGSGTDYLAARRLDLSVDSSYDLNVMGGRSDNLRGLETLPNGHVLMMDGHNKVLHEFSPDATLLDSTSLSVRGGWVRDFTLDESGNIVVVSVLSHPANTHVVTLNAGQSAGGVDFGDRPEIAGPRITEHSPAGVHSPRVSHLDVSFSEPIDAETFTADEVALSGPPGTIQPSRVAQVSDNTFRIAFPEQSMEGAYTVAIGPEIADLAGNLMDQDQDGNNGESGDDQAQATFLLGQIEHIAYGFDPSLEAGPGQDGLHLSFYDGDYLQYGHRQAGAWAFENIDDAHAHTGHYSSIALAPNGSPRVSYSDFYPEPDQLVYAERQATGWALTDVGSGSLIHETSLGITEEGESWIVFGVFPYYDDSYRELQYRHHDGASWHQGKIDTEGLSGSRNSLDINPVTSLPGVVYTEQEGETLKYAEWNGTSWTPVVVARDVPYSYNSLRYDSEGQPRIAFVDASQNLIYVRREADTWLEEVVAEGVSDHAPVRLELDAEDEAHLAYAAEEDVEDPLGSEYTLSYAFQNRQDWTHLPIVARNRSVETGQAYDFTLGPDAVPYLVFTYTGHAGRGLYLYDGSALRRPPEIFLSNRDIEENSPVGTTVGTVSIRNSDPGDTYTYSIVSPDVPFHVDNGNQFQVADLLDYETETQHDVMIRATNASGERFDGTVAVNVLDVNEPPVISELSDAPDPVLQPGGLMLQAGQVSDPDEGDSVTKVRFYLDSNSDGEWDSGDDVLGTDTDGTDVWSVTVGSDTLPIGENTYLARAYDGEAWSVGAGIADATGHVLQDVPVEVGLEIVELDDTPGIGIGESFEVEVDFADVRDPDNPQAVFSGYADIAFDPQVLRVDGIVHDGDFQNAAGGTIDNTTGLVDEAGGTDGLDPVEDTRVFTLQMTAVGGGVATIEANAGEDAGSEIAVFGSDDDFRDDASYGSASVEVEAMELILQVRDADGNPLPDGATLQKGQEFRIYGLARDLRTTGEDVGVFSAYADVEYDTTLIDVTGITHHEDFSNSTDGTILEGEGLVDEVGGTDGLSQPDARDPQEVFYLSATAVEAGTLQVESNAGEDAGSENTLFGLDVDVRDGTRWGRAEVEIVEIPDLVPTRTVAASRHVLDGQTQLSYGIENQGSGPAAAFETDVVLSRDGVIGNGDDRVVTTLELEGLAAGETAEGTVILDLDKSVLNEWAQEDDPAGVGSGHRSANREWIGLVVDPDDLIEETNERNNVRQRRRVGKDHITYFPWDLDDSHVVTPTDAIFVINRLGQEAPDVDGRADLDGNGVVTPTDAIGVINRLGYEMNTDVVEVAPAVASTSEVLAEPNAAISRVPVTTAGDSDEAERAHQAELELRRGTAGSLGRVVVSGGTGGERAREAEPAGAITAPAGFMPLRGGGWAESDEGDNDQWVQRFLGK